tara:strand:- start:1491 stop:1868 length:378 start_codon:yes stop_codon:yes gene_type:complete
MNEFDLVFVFVSCNVLFLALWFKSNAVYEYLKVFRFDKVKFLDEAFGLSEYEYFLKRFKSNISYAEYTQVINDNFFGRFVSCPLCLSFWIQSPIILLDIKYFPMCVISSVMIYSLYCILQKHGTN